MLYCVATCCSGTGSAAFPFPSALRTTHHCVCRLRAAPQRVEELQQQKAYMVQWEREGLLEHAKNLTKRRSQVKGTHCYSVRFLHGFGRAECCSTPRG